jgi:type II secretory pathway pseudopilin PulG
MTSHPPARRRVRREAGFALIDLLVAATILALALLGHASTVLGGHRLSRSVEHRTVALEAARQFVERIRSDADWTGLYATFVSLYSPTAGANGMVGRPATDYYADFITPRDLGTVRVLVSVPRVGADLREDAALPGFGLPNDLNADGTIDANPHQSDYVVLPVAIRFSWFPAGETVQSVEISTWLSEAR